MCQKWSILPLLPKYSGAHVCTGDEAFAERRDRRDCYKKATEFRVSVVLCTQVRKLLEKAPHQLRRRLHIQETTSIVVVPQVARCRGLHLLVVVRRGSLHAAMGTERGSRTVADAIKDIEVEMIRGPGDAVNAVKLSSFWEDQPVVIHLLRRFGCQLCRGQSVEMAKMLPQLEANNVRVVGIGLERFGLEEFEEKKFWKSELYIDNGKKIHNALALTKVGWVGTFKMLFANQSVKDATEKTKDTPGNLQGDGRQLGATFVMAKGGEMLLDHRQKDFGDQPTNAEILEALGLDASQAK